MKPHRSQQTRSMGKAGRFQILRARNGATEAFLRREILPPQTTQLLTVVTLALRL
jgi:hypothetical protein